MTSDNPKKERLDKKSDNKKNKLGYSVFILGNKCYRCGHEWRPRNLKEKPAVCPNCKSPYWDKPKSKN